MSDAEHPDTASQGCEETVKTCPGEPDETTEPVHKRPMLRLGLFIAAVGFSSALLTFVVGNWIVMPLVVHSSSVIVPDLYGIDVGVAKRDLVGRGLVFVNDSTDYVADELVPANHIVSQDPPPYSEVKSGRRIHVVISRGPQLAAVPDVVNRGATEAKLRLNRAGFKLGRVILELRDRPEYSDPFVIAQEPVAGSRAARGDSVHIRVSISPQVPNLAGRSYEHARTILTMLGMRVGAVSYESDERNLPYSVLRQSVAPGSMAHRDERVDLVLSRL